MNIHLIMIHNGENVGDKNQSLGIISALLEFKSDAMHMTHEEFSSKTQAMELLHGKMVTLLSEGIQLVLVSAGSSGLIVLHALKQCYPSVKSLWSGHQVFKEIDLFEHALMPDLMAFPKHQEPYIPEFLKAKTRLVLTDGVPHNVSDSTIASDLKLCEERGIPLPMLAKKTAVIILPGDAPDVTGVDKLFTGKHAVLLADRIHACYSDYHFAVTNGPRTGKHLDPLAHRTGLVDSVTQAFSDRLAELSGRKPAIYDFQFSSLPSAYKPLLHAVKTGDDHILLCPGESTSMVTETLGYLPREKVVILEVPEVMNEAHYGHMLEMIKMENVRTLNPSGLVCVTSTKSSESKGELAATQIAREYYKDLSAPALVLYPKSTHTAEDSAKIAAEL